jgi:ATP-dependent DNA helicase RecQ
MGTHDSSSLFENFQLKNAFSKVPSSFNRNRNTKSKEDIIKELGLKEPQLLRNRLQEKYCLHGFEVEDKLFESNKFLEKTQSSIIYVRNRKSCIEISSCNSFGFKATYYHGLTSRKKIKTCSFGWTIGPGYCCYKCIWNGH